MLISAKIFILKSIHYHCEPVISAMLRCIKGRDKHFRSTLLKKGCYSNTFWGCSYRCVSFTPKGVLLGCYGNTPTLGLICVVVTPLGCNHVVTVYIATPYIHAWFQAIELASKRVWCCYDQDMQFLVSTIGYRYNISTWLGVKKCL